MYTTRYSLMGRVRDGGDKGAWEEFYSLYCPLIFRYCRQRGLGRTDAEEVVSMCFAELSQAMSGFEYQPDKGRFKSWLRKLVNFKISDFLKGQRDPSLPLETLADVSQTDQNDPLWEQAWKNELLNHSLAQVRSLVSTGNYQVFQLNVIEGWPAEKVGEVLGLSIDQVYRAKYKVVQQVREVMNRYRQDEA